MVVSAYEKQVRGLLKSSPEYQAVSKRIGIRDEVVAISIKALGNLDAAAKNLTGVSDLSSTKAILDEAAERYATAKQMLDATSTEPNALPKKIDTSAASALGNIGQVITIIFSRWLDITTYFYILVALMLDIILVIAFQRVLQVGSDPADKWRGTTTNIL